jgi:hypothetical protein
MKKILRATYKTLHDLIARLVGFEVVACWDKTLHTHWALNDNEAREWARAYRDVSASVRVWSGDRQV